MVAARRQKQAQKLQEQQISKALAESKPSRSHVSFDDDDDSNEAGDVLETATSLVAPLVPEASAEAPMEGSDDNDEPIEVVSNKASRKEAARDSARLKAQEKAEKAKRRAAERKRAEKSKQKEEATKSVHNSAEVTGQTAHSSDESEGSSEEDEPSSSTRLDPSLFAEVFAHSVAAPKSILKKRSAEERADEVAKLQRERKQRRKEQRAGGVVKGRDGLPMKRVEDGTVLRALNTSTKHKISFDHDDTAGGEIPLDDVVRPALLDPSASLPNAKARAFKKRNLLRKKPTLPTRASSKASGTSKSKKREEDPLGLNDPAFLPGGEFYHLVNKGDKAKSPRQGRQEALASVRQAYRGGGTRKDAVSVLRARSRGGPSLGFARSQEVSDDED